MTTMIDQGLSALGMFRFTPGLNSLYLGLRQQDSTDWTPELLGLVWALKQAPQLAILSLDVGGPTQVRCDVLQCSFMGCNVVWPTAIQ